jgi:hypothetical protein
LIDPAYEVSIEALEYIYGSIGTSIDSNSRLRLHGSIRTDLLYFSKKVKKFR